MLSYIVILVYLCLALVYYVICCYTLDNIQIRQNIEITICVYLYYKVIKNSTKYVLFYTLKFLWKIMWIVSFGHIPMKLH